MDTVVPADFEQEFEAERAEWMRRRVRVYCMFMIGIAVPRLIAITISLQLGLDSTSVLLPVGILQVLAAAAYMGGLGAVLFWLHRHEPTKEQLLRLTWRIVVVVGVVDIAYITVLAPMVIPEGVDHVLTGPLAPAVTLGSLMILHLAAAVFVPWTPAEALRPIVPLILLCIVATLLFSPVSLAWRVRIAIITPVVALPGLGVCWRRHGLFVSRFMLRMLDTAYGAMKQELVAARRIQESMFPEPFESETVRLDFHYQPHRDLGGDYVFARRGGERLTVIVLDVTGHGIAAALTVNRLHGELERLFAEDADLGPAEAMTALNRYVELTLAPHSVFATGLGMRVDAAAGTVQWVNAGHPPAFLRSADGAVERLEATGPWLGASDAIGAVQQRPFEAGASILAYTDGVIEAVDGEGRMLQIDGLEALLEEPRTPRRLLRAIERRGYRLDGDDALLVEVGRVAPR